jgi:ribosomal protein S18 acetylase RimI-like enzyme
MPVFRLIQSLASLEAGPGQPPAPPAAALVKFVRGERESDRVRQLARAVREAGEVAPRAAGLLAETVSRPERQVEVWLAQPTGQPAVHPPSQPDGLPLLGLVTLVAGRSAAGERASIAWLLVHPVARRRGIGRLLVGQALRRAQAQGARKVQVECRADWQGAIAFWEAVGFQRLSADRAGS